MSVPSAGPPAPAAASQAPTAKPAEQTMRVAFVGQSVFFSQCALQEPSHGLDPHFIDFRAGSAPEPLLASLRALEPDVILVFRPEIVPPGLFSSLSAVTIGYLTEPLPRTGGEKHADLLTRLWWLEQTDASNFDRIVSFDPLIAETAQRVIPVWRSLAIPVADGLFMDVRPRTSPPGILFIGRSTEHREQLLAPVKRSYPVMHVGHGLFGERLTRFLARADVQLNLHNNPYPSFENRVCIALAAGQLVISEPLSPRHGLTPGEHYVEVHGPEQLLEAVGRVVEDGEAFAEVQRQGRRAAEAFRASTVYPTLLRDAVADVASAGSARRR